MTRILGATSRGPWTSRVALLLLLGHGAGVARSQEQLRNQNDPILVVSPGGHSAPVRVLVFTPDGSQLLSAGMDKVVAVWDLKRGVPRLARTLRPPIWRGLRGAIYAMALSPRQEGGQGTLAVAGYGVITTAGNIALYRFPGQNEVPTGDIAAQLLSDVVTRDPRMSPGHLGVVKGLQFSPGGESLASASQDGTVRIWDVGARKTTLALGPHGRDVNALAFTPDGKRLVSGTSGGELRLWDATRGDLLAVAPIRPGASPDLESITALAVSPDGKWVVVGRESGALSRLDAADLGNETPLPTNRAEQGAVLSLAFSHDGKRLASSLVSHGRTSLAARPRVECDVELRAMPGGAVEVALFSDAAGSFHPALTNLAHACAFSPDDALLAVAGGDAQAIHLVDLKGPNLPFVELKGQGQSIWDVGFGADSRSVGFSRRPPSAPGPFHPDEAFDLADRDFKPPGRDAYPRAETTLQGWSVRATTSYQLEILTPRGVVHRRLQLDEAVDRRWWAFGFIPPVVGEHPNALVAVGCDAGTVVLFDLQTGRRVRELVGHADKVYALAPSPDGRWLASGSADQTIRLWRLAGRDRIPALGATFGRTATGTWVVTRVEPRGFAEAIGLREKDVVRGFTSEKVAQDLDTALPRVDDVPPGRHLGFTVAREGRPVPLAETTKRDSAALTLFPGRNREWVLWMPDGYYDTSIAGDRRHLGWHLNRQPPGRVDQPTDFVPIDRYEARFHQPGVLARLIETGSAVEAMKALPPGLGGGPAAQMVQPPVVRLVEPNPTPGRPLEFRAPPPPLRLVVTNQAPGRVRAVRVMVDGRLDSQLPPYEPPLAEVTPTVPLTLEPGRHQVNVLAVNDQGIEGNASFEAVLATPPPRPPRLAILSFGAERFSGRLPVVELAAKDARDLGDFLAAPGGRPRYDKPEASVFDDPDEATAGRIAAALASLGDECDRASLGRGDTVFVVLESHFLTYDGQVHLVGTDLAEKAPPSPGLPAEFVSDVLGKLVAAGCRVVLFTDMMHRPASRPRRDAFRAWVRDLYKRRGVIVFVASKDGPSEALSKNRAFAEAVTSSLDVRSLARLRPVGPAPVTLWEFRDTVINRVRELAEGQYADGYLPDTISPQVPIFDPQTGLP